MSQAESGLMNRNGQGVEPVPNPEVKPKPKHRQFSSEYKRRIVEEADACRASGQIGALLRREGLYSSHLTTWRQQRKLGTLQALKPKTRGPKPEPLAAENAQLRREVERLRSQLERAETIITVQKKLSHLLGVDREPNPSDEPA